jgi:hypothetical protein
MKKSLTWDILRKYLTNNIFCDIDEGMKEDGKSDEKIPGNLFSRVSLEFHKQHKHLKRFFIE